VLTLVLGGASSGKSRYAEGLMASLPRPWTYIATAEALDDEMAARITAHRARRGHGWITREAPRELVEALDAHGTAPALVDCLTLWLSNLMLAGRDVGAEIDRLEDRLRRSTAELVLVSNEVGSGIVPDNALARRFRDLQGSLNQRIAACTDRVILVVAGLPVIVKGQP
jgi:adenosylcobinamide kinase/adenosylcobinamide-phosphate guanylyltransferase